MFSLASQLNAKGVLGLNRRNADYISRFNSRALFPNVDNKLFTKKLAQAAGLNVPALLGVVTYPSELAALPKLLESRSDFVVKPAKGSGGEGVLVVSGRSGQGYRTIDGHILSQQELDRHVAKILSGMFSLGGQTDQAMFEQRVRFNPVFDQVTYLGVPDIRIIVFLGVPVMAMVRLPTRRSKGKANLHQGAIGAGVDISSGALVSAVWGERLIDSHPDTGVALSGLVVPSWRDILNLGAKAFELSGLGYQGVDIVIDQDNGPLILELNARPGLSIQLANRAGLLPRLKLVEQKGDQLKSLSDRIEFATQHFKSS